MMQWIDEMRRGLDRGVSQSYSARRTQLLALKQGIQAMEPALLAALQFDLGKSTYESYISELGFIQAEIDLFLRRLKGWMRPQKQRLGLAQFPGKARLYPESYGLVLIMSPWNYPLLTSLVPLIGAIAAGNAVVLRPSSKVPATAATLKKLVDNYLDPTLVRLVDPSTISGEQLLQARFDLIFFTGSTAVGKRVMQAAAKHLTPVILELGGKSPVLIDASADLEIAVRRILFGKLMNSGQTCVAPDYVLLPEHLKSAFVEEVKRIYPQMIPNAAYAQAAIPQMINSEAYARLEADLVSEEVLFAAGDDPSSRRMGLRLVTANTDSKLMQREIFGPILPLLTYRNIKAAIDYIRAQEKPLALYLFTRDPALERRVLDRLSFGGGCINDTLIHLAGPMPFGGVGASGMGKYHGQASFDAFSHYKGVLKRGRWLDNPLRYHPYRNLDRGLPISFFRHI